MKYKFLLFDADETLLDFKLAEKKALSATLLRFGLPENDEIQQVYSRANAEQWALLEKGLVTKEDLKSNRFKNFCEYFGYCCDPTEMSEWYIKCLADQSHVIEDADRICSLLADKYEMYIVTNGFKYSQTKRIKNSLIYKYFKNFFISEDIGYEKPNINFFLEASRQIQDFRKEDAIIIGDSLSSDILGGITFGIDTCWYNPTGKNCPKEITPTYIIDNLNQLINLL